MFIYISDEQNNQVTKSNQDLVDSGDTGRAGTSTLPIADDKNSKQSSETGAANELAIEVIGRDTFLCLNACFLLRFFLIIEGKAESY